MAAARTPGRRPGDSTTRDELLAAARAEFSSHGFDKATVRGIAARAGVDPAMIKHHFGSKGGLFTASVELPFDPAEIAERVFTGDLDTLGHRLAATFLTLWDSAGGEAATSLVRTAASSPEAADRLREFLIERVMRGGFSQLTGWTAEARWRASLIASQLVGLLIARYIVRFEPLASARIEDAARAVAPNLQHYLTGDVGSPPPIGEP